MPFISSLEVGEHDDILPLKEESSINDALKLLSLKLEHRQDLMKTSPIRDMLRFYYICDSALRSGTESVKEPCRQAIVSAMMAYNSNPQDNGIGTRILQPAAKIVNDYLLKSSIAIFGSRGEGVQITLDQIPNIRLGPCRGNKYDYELISSWRGFGWTQSQFDDLVSKMVRKGAAQRSVNAGSIEIDEFDNRMIQFWKSKCKTSKGRNKWFKRMISMYDTERKGGPGQFFRKSFPSLYGFLLNTYSVDDSFERINDESRLLYPTTRNIREVIHAAVWRVAGFPDDPETFWFNPGKFSQVFANHPSSSENEPDMDSQAQSLLGSTDQRPPDNAVTYALSPRIDRAYTFGILSPARVYRNDFVNTPLRHIHSHWVHVLHVWGVNLDSPQTQDWAEIVNKNTVEGVINNEGLKIAYHARMVELFSIIKKAIVETVDIVTDKYPRVTTVHVRIPGIGLGKFLNGLRIENSEENLKDICRIEFLKVMNAVLFSKTDDQILSSASDETKRRRLATQKRPIKLSLRFVEAEWWRGEAATSYNQASGFTSQTSPESPRSFAPSESLFDYKDPTDEGSAYYLLVNAWDNMSFIGGGGSQDESLDGWIAGGYTLTPRFASTVWLSNLHMIPSLVDHTVPVRDDSE